MRLPRLDGKRLLALVREHLPGGANRGAWMRALWGGFCFLSLGLLLASGVGPRGVDVVLGQVSPRDVEAPRTLIDRPTTQRLRQEAADRVLPLYVRNPEVAIEVDRSLEEAFSSLRAIRLDEGIDAASKLSGPRDALGVDLSPASAEALLAAGDDLLARVEQDLRDVVGREMEKNITEDDLDTFRKEVVGEARALDHPRPILELMALMAEARLRPNFFLDEARTRERRAMAMTAVAPVTIVKGEMIVRRGDKVTVEDLARLQDAGLLGHRGAAARVGGAFLVAGLLVSAAATSLRFMRPLVYAQTSRLVLVGLIGLGAAALAVILVPVSPYLAPVPGAAMLLAVLIDPVVAAMGAVFLSFFVGFLAGHAVEPAAVAFLGALAGIFAVQSATQRGEIIRAGFAVALIQVTAILGVGAAVGDLDPARVPRDLLAGVANGVLLAGVLTAGSLSSFENLFGILTPLKLLELSDPNQPLLRRLLLEAPGTYHHSLLVANLAEAAAEAVGADALLARVGAYYHDIGKVKRPYFFVENQFGGRNPHDKLSPHLSALIITSHVKEGVDLARQYRLPEDLVRFISEHHGTTMLTFFYHRAVAGGEGDVQQERFRHQGPVPQSREAAIVMLADAAEAVVRSLSRPTPGRVQAAVRRVIRERLNDGQLDQCHLTLKDLNAMADAFVRVLGGVYHARIEYPQGASPGQGGVAGDVVDQRKPGVRDTRPAS